MKLQYGLYPTASTKNELYEKGKDEKVLKFKAVQSNGIVVEMTVKGPRETVEQTFLGFPVSKGVKILVTMDNSQNTLVSTLIAAPIAKKPAQKQMAASASPAASNNPDDEKEVEEDSNEDEGDEDEDEEETLEDLANKIATKPKTKVKA
jgi:hypothetical protein